MTEPARPSSVTYTQAVPAVRRALAALEHLAQEPDGLTLSALARALQVSPSSLLAILKTLLAKHYVARDPETRRYRLASGARLLASAAAAPPDLQREFAPIADRLAAELGETVLLWVLDGSEVAVVAFREGSHELRWVPRPGLRRWAAEAAPGRVLLAVDDPALEQIRRSGIDTEESTEEPRLRSLAAPVLGDQALLLAALAVTGPASRLRGPREVSARAALTGAAAELSRRLGCRDYRPYGYPTYGHAQFLSADPARPNAPSAEAAFTHHGGLTRDELDRFLREPWVARLACVKENGYPYVVPVWYEWDGASFWIVARTRTEWADCVRQNPRVSMSIDEPDPPLRRVIVEAQAEFIDSELSESQSALVSRIAERYLGAASALYLKGMPARPYALIRVVPVKLTTWRGLISHPRYRPANDRGIA